MSDLKTYQTQVYRQSRGTFSTYQVHFIAQSDIAEYGIAYSMHSLLIPERETECYHVFHINLLTDWIRLLQNTSDANL